MSEMTIEEYEKIDPKFELEVNGVKIFYSVPNRHTLWRVHSLETKEPDTLEWISGFKKHDILLDVGANVGMYTIWAAMTIGVTVFAFEPEAQNFALLNKNILTNGLQDHVTAYPVALNDTTEFGDLHLSSFHVGGSCHSFGEAVDFHLKPRHTGLRQGCFSTSIDKMILEGAMPCPNYIKIDVDGIEHKVLSGAEITLDDHRVKSILVELNTNLDLHVALIESLENRGFKLWREKLAISIRQEGEFKGVGNHIFQRN